MMDIVINLPRPLGEFQIKKWKNGKVVYDSGICKNIVTNNFYVLWFNFPQRFSTDAIASQTIMRHCAVSNDSNEVVKEDTALAGQITTKATYAQKMPAITVETIEGKEYYKISRRYLWNQGEFNNVTISKIGILCDNGSGLTDRLIAGQLIKDGLGNPVTITILSDEQLDITYTLYIPKMNDIVGIPGVQIINGIEYPYALTVHQSRLCDQYSDLSLCTLLSTAQASNDNNYYVNGNKRTVMSATKTNYTNRMEMVYTISIPSGSGFNPINTLGFGQLYWNAAISALYPRNQSLLTYTFTGEIKPIKLSTDTFEATVKITIKWDD